MATDNRAYRTSTGRFAPGNSGGPGKKRMDETSREMLELATPHAVKRLLEALDAETVVHYQGVEVGTYVDHGRRLEAVQILLDRLYGRPSQAITGSDGEPLQLGPQVNIALITSDDMRALNEIKKRLSFDAVSSDVNDGSENVAEGIVSVDPKP